MTYTEENLRTELPVRQRQSPQSHQSHLEQETLQRDIRYRSKKRSENTIEESLNRAKLRLEKQRNFGNKPGPMTLDDPGSSRVES